MKKINLKGISEILSEKELKNVMGGSGSSTSCPVLTSSCSGDCISHTGSKGKCTSILSDIGTLCGCAAYS